MASLKDVKLKITGIHKTKQITKAMYMVASAKLRGAQNRIERFRPYASKFRSVLGDLAKKADTSSHPLLQHHDEKKELLILLITSDRGLCGGFNLNLITKAIKLAEEKQKEGMDVRFICVGKKGRDAVNKAGFAFHSFYTNVLNDFDFSLATQIGKKIIADYTAQSVDEVLLVYGEFVNAAKQEPKVQQLLPIEPQSAEEGQEETLDNNREDYVYEPDVQALLAEIVPRFVMVQMYRALLDTSASEHAARMAAMDNATRNCDDMTKALTLLYNKTRQASITTELMDIVSGSEALIA